MTDSFHPQEILKIAINVEKNGEQLYAILEKKAKEERIKELWKYLKEQEETHRRTFSDMLNNTGEFIIPEFAPGEYEAYLRAIASGFIFTQELIEKKTKELFSSDIETLDFGIWIEKESILTYSALREYLVTAKQSVLDKVIAEERNHLVQLTSLKDTLQ